MSLQPSRQSGVALLAALILMLAVVMVMGNIFYRHQIDITQAAASIHSDQALLLAMSGESWARQLLSDQEDDRAVDSFDEDWAQALPMLPVDGGMITGCISDLQGRININNFADYSAQSLQKELDADNSGLAIAWLQLLTQLDLLADPSRVAQIIDWLDADSNLINSWGAEQADYDSLLSPRVPANSKVTDISELAAIKSYQVAEVQLLAPWLSALPRHTSININTASQPLISALVGMLSQDIAALVIEERPFESINEFYQLMLQNTQLALPEVQLRWPETLISVNSDYFELYLEVILGEARIEVRSIMDRFKRNEPVIIARQLTFVPAALPKPSLSAAEALFNSEADSGILGDPEAESSAGANAGTNAMQSACIMIGETN
jgi:general secretion pathway protein K